MKASPFLFFVLSVIEQGTHFEREIFLVNPGLPKTQYAWFRHRCVGSLVLSIYTRSHSVVCRLWFFLHPCWYLKIHAEGISYWVRKCQGCRLTKLSDVDQPKIPTNILIIVSNKILGVGTTNEYVYTEMMDVLNSNSAYIKMREIWDLCLMSWCTALLNKFWHQMASRPRLSKVW